MTGKCNCKIDLKEIDVEKIKNKNNEEEKKEKNIIKCYKCKNIAIINSRVNTCKECFINLFSKNFRGNLRTKCLNKVEKGRFLSILASGDYVSTSLIHLLLSRNDDRHYKEEEEEEEENYSGKIKSIRKITDSDDVKLRLIVNIEGAVNEEDFRTESKKYFETVKSVFLKFNEECGLQKGRESDNIMESKIGDVTIASLKGCNFLHMKRQGKENNDCKIEERLNKCNEECEEFIEKCKQIYEEDSDLAIHIRRSLKLINLKAYLHDYLSNNGLNSNKKNTSSKASVMNGMGSVANTSTNSNSDIKKTSNGNGEEVNGIYVLTGDTMDDISRQTIYLTCLGLGEQVSYRTAFVDTESLEGVKILRPLKTFSDKEVSLYHRINKLSQMGKINIIPKSRASILGCINLFTEEINTRSSTGLHNIIKVTNKLINTPSKQRCTVCEIHEDKEDYAKNNRTNEYVCNGCNYFKLIHTESYEFFKNKFTEARTHESKCRNQ